MKSNHNRLIVGVSGASGVVYGIRLLQLLRQKGGFETHLVMTRAAQITLAHESTLKVSDVHALADVVHASDDIGAGISSGSFKTQGMIVAPCSVRPLCGI